MNSSTPQTLRAAVVGLGRMGIRHVQALKQLGADIVGVVDVSEAARASVRAELNLQDNQCFSDGAEMLRAVRPEALVVATTAPSHAELVSIAAELKVRFILCEKPMATSLADARRMEAICRANGALLAVNHQMRFMSYYKHVKSLIGSDELGPLSSIVVSGSNFGLAMNASHYFEMFRFISETSIKEVHGWFEAEILANPRGAAFEDRSGSILARNADGLPMYLSFSVNSGNGIIANYICRHGQITVDELNGDVRVLARKPEFRDLPTTRYGMPSDIRNEAVAPADVIRPTIDLWAAMLNGGSYPDADAGVHALSCCVAAYMSHESGGRAVNLDEAMNACDRRFKWA